MPDIANTCIATGFSSIFVIVAIEARVMLSAALFVRMTASFLSGSYSMRVRPVWLAPCSP